MSEDNKKTESYHAHYLLFILPQIQGFSNYALLESCVDSKTHPGSQSAGGIHNLFRVPRYPHKSPEHTVVYCSPVKVVLPRLCGIDSNVGIIEK